jgi:hypothetical protein
VPDPQRGRAVGRRRESAAVLGSAGYLEATSGGWWREKESREESEDVGGGRRWRGRGVFEEEKKSNRNFPLPHRHDVPCAVTVFPRRIYYYCQKTQTTPQSLWDGDRGCTPSGDTFCDAIRQRDMDGNGQRERVRGCAWTSSCCRTEMFQPSRTLSLRACQRCGCFGR